MKEDKSRKIFKTTVIVLLFIIWVWALLRMTIFGREASETYRMKMEFFWTIKEAWSKKSAQDWFFLIANIYIFIPLGILLPIMFKRMRSLLNNFVAGLACSFVIELTQYVFKLGYFEFDDLFNNTLGTVMGYALFIVGATIFKKYKPTKAELIWSTGLIIIVNMFLLCAVAIGQPVFDEIGYYIHYYVKMYFT